MVTYIDGHKERFGVEPICAVLPIAPSTYYAHKVLQRHPDRRSDRARVDTWLKGEIERVWEDNYRVYGVRKVWRQLQREGVVVARCTGVPPELWTKAMLGFPQSEENRGEEESLQRRTDRIDTAGS